MHGGGKVCLVGPSLGYGELRTAEGMLANEGSGGKGNEPLCREGIGEFEQGIVEVAIAIEHDRHRRRIVSFEIAKPLEGYGRDAAGIDRDGYDGQLVVDVFFCVGRSVGQVCLMIGGDSHPFDKGVGDARRSVGGREVDDMDIFKAHK